VRAQGVEAVGGHLDEHHVGVLAGHPQAEDATQ
jgi:hypothetical protein